MPLTKREREASASVLKAMAHPVRLGIIELLAEGEMTVTELYSALQCSQSAMSNQLNVLRAQRLVATRSEGTTKYYSLRNRDFLRLFHCLKTHLHDVLKVD